MLDAVVGNALLLQNTIAGQSEKLLDTVSRGAL
jgi:hypothetical protein